MAERFTVAYDAFHAVQNPLRNSSGALAMAGSPDMTTQASPVANGLSNTILAWRKPRITRIQQTTTSKQRESHALTPPLTSESLLFCRKTIYTLT